jgi:alpha-galactosidase
MLVWLVGLVPLAARSLSDHPIIQEQSPIPGINGPRIVGSTPGRPFLFLVPATGEGPLSFSAENLPDGLTLDSKTGIITGSLQKDGDYVVKVTVAGPKGEDSRNLNIVGGTHELALTPPMGWNSWNVWGLSVSDDKVRAAADAMVESSLAAHGFQFVNIDDGWENGRAEDGRILTNDKFPDMRALSGYVHSRGLKLGIYSSPGEKTCGLYEGSWAHELQDAQTYAEWGIDYLKYDWCSYTFKMKGIGMKTFKKPYIEMRDHLDAVDRDIVYSLCQYGMRSVWKWGGEVGGNLWRTTGDIRDSWLSMSTIGFGQDGHEKYAGPGRWNDPDMLVVGRVGWGPTLHESGLTKEEQITHISLWCMLSSPLLIGCDMANMDEFTVAVLTNDEVLAVNQDPLGKQASRVAKDGKTQVWARPLWDGTQAVALFNLDGSTKEVTAEWSNLGISGEQPVRNLWLHKDLGSFNGSFKASVPSHGAVMLKVGKPDKEDFSL